jgi:hypothetical protein
MPRHSNAGGRSSRLPPKKEEKRPSFASIASESEAVSIDHTDAQPVTSVSTQGAQREAQTEAERKPVRRGSRGSVAARVAARREAASDELDHAEMQAIREERKNGHTRDAWADHVEDTHIAGIFR